MDQQKIGKFILELRKEKNMTQQELATKIGVTDRAVSKWENGRGLPDLSLLVPLCKILEISINELLSGKKLDKKDYKEKLEENIMNTIDYTDKKIKRTKKIFTAILSIFLIFIITILSMFGVDVNRMRNNKPVIFSTWGFCYTPAIDIKEEEIELSVINYIIEEGDNEYKHHENEKTFASIKVYLLEEKERDKHYIVYAWVLQEKYYLENDIIKQDSGFSMPHKFDVKNINGNFIVTNSQFPRDGSYYAIDMKNIFPSSVRSDMKNVQSDGTIARLQLDIEQQTKLYFHK